MHRGTHLAASVVLLVFAAAGLGGASGCSKGDEGDVHLKRDSDAPAVVEIEGSAQLDLGSAKEVEPNNVTDKATPLELPVAVTGVLSSSRDVDYFSFVATKNGHARVFLRPVDGADLMVETSSKADDMVRVGDRGPNTAEGIPNLPVKRGETYFVAVKEYVKQPRRRKKRKGKKSEEKVREGDSPPYQLEIAIEAKPAHSEGIDREIEPNDTIDTAKLIMTGDRPGAYIGWSNDVDFYKLSLEGFTEKDLVEISLDGVDGARLNLELTDPEGEVVLKRKSDKSGPIYVRGLQTRGAAYFIAKVFSERSHESQRYRFHFATRRLLDGDEVEPNDRAKAATSMGASGDEEGSSRGEIFGSDVDWFALPTATVRRALKLDLEVAGGVRVEVDAIVSGDSLGVLRADTRTMEVIVEPGARLRLKVTGKGGGEPTEYTLEWTTSEVADTEPTDSLDPADLLE